MFETRLISEILLWLKFPYNHFMLLIQSRYYVGTIKIDFKKLNFLQSYTLKTSSQFNKALSNIYRYTKHTELEFITLKTLRRCENHVQTYTCSGIVFNCI